MNKHISINISGIIFHVEEEAFERLKSYLNKVNKYFSSYTGGEEVMSDIEARIAEFFLDRLDEYKEYITLEDVEDLQATMGTVSDWAAADEYANMSEEVPATKASYTGTEPKKLYRDEQRRLIGGVASGIAHYFSVDPLWIRLAFLLFFFDFSSFTSITGVAIITYVVLWAILPASYNLEDSDAVRRLFRDSESRVLGGVASGVAAYFRIQPALVRIIFVLSTFLGGLGLLTYLILWAITPVAKSLTERMQMKGEPITLENIEEQIKQRFKIDENEPESPVVRALLFPLRVLSGAIDRFNSDVDQTLVLQKGGHFLLFAIGSTMTLFATVVSIAMFGVLGAYFGLGQSLGHEIVHINGAVPLSIIQATIPSSTVIFGFLIAWVPMAFVGILGMSIASRRIVTKSVVNWSLLGLWIVGIVGGALTIPMVAAQFRSEGTQKELHTIEATYPEAFRILVKDDKNPRELNFNRVHLRIMGHDKPEVELLQKFSSNGCSRQMAIECASDIDYDFELRDSTLILSPIFKLAEGTPFRKQSLWMELYMPYGKEFVMSEEVGGIIRNTLHHQGFTVNDLGMKNRWVYQEDGLHCITCEDKEEINSTTSQPNGQTVKEMDLLTSIQEVKLTGLGEVTIVEGSQASLKIEGHSATLEQINIRMDDEQLSIRNEEHIPSKIVITLPHLNYLRIEGPMLVNVEGLHQENMKFDLSEGARLKGDFSLENVEIRIKEGASMEMVGEATNVELNAKEGAHLDFSHWNVENMGIRAKEGAFVKLGPVENLEERLSEGARVVKIEE